MTSEPIRDGEADSPRRRIGRATPSSGEPRDPFREALLVLGGLVVAGLGLLAFSSALSGDRLSIFLEPLEWLADLSPDTAYQTLVSSAQIVAGLLGIAITVVAIVLELAANRYSHRITWLFVREPVNILVLGLFVVTTLLCIWVASAFSGSGAALESDAVLPGAGFAVAMTLVTLSLLAVLPYFNFVLAFLSPVNMIAKIRDGAIRRIERVGLANLEETQCAVEEAIDELQDVARSSTEQSDRRVAMASVEALTELLEGYDRLRDELPPSWFEVAPAVAADPDFAALTPTALDEIERSRTWLDVKIMQQYLSLMSECVPRARDIANAIAISTRRIATGPGRRRPALRALCIRCMNSYLRTCINARDPRTTYYIMNQYRLVAEEMLLWGLPDEAMDVARYLKFYGNLGYSAAMPFLLETVSHDLIQLIEWDLANGGLRTDALLALLLDLDREMRDESQEESLLGIRCSQMQVATLFLERGDLERAERIAADLATDSPGHLARAQSRLEYAVDPQYWEITARGVNFTYLPPARRVRLDDVARMVEKVRTRGAAGQVSVPA